MKSIFFQLLVFLALSSCAPTRSLVYFKDLRDADYKEVIKNKTDPEIQPDDLLSISVSSLNPESNVLFNNGVLQTVGSTSSAVATPRTSDGYLVNTDGTINFPVLGKVTVAGLTKDQVTEKLTLEIKKSVKNPIVNIRLINFKVTIVGEVARPSTFNVPSERINLIEALGLAGDLTAYGKRNNILVVREKDGTRSTFRINLESKDVFNSPVFYLQQNDIVYVEPVKSRIQQTNGVTFYLPFVSLVLTIVTALIVFTK